VTNEILATLYAFGKLRQCTAVQLLTKDHPSFLGFETLDTPERLSLFIKAQASINWPQQLTQELSKVPGSRASKASTALAGLWDLQSDSCFWTELKLCTTYKAMIDKLASLPSNGVFIAKNVAEVILYALSWAGAGVDACPSFNSALDDYRADPEAVFEPGPTALSATQPEKCMGIYM
jgi:hypothetical protein